MVQTLFEVQLSKPKIDIIFILFLSLLLVFSSFFPSFNAVYSESIQQSNKVIEASGHFANNQLENGTVTWIQGGLWNLRIYNLTTSNPSNGINNTMENNNSNNYVNSNNNIDNNNNDNNNSSSSSIYTANFLANFTMVKPDGSLSHGHIIKNFTSDNVILTKNDIVITGITDILSNNKTLEYHKVPLTIHLMGKKVLGLMIDAKKTGRHFASSNEFFGTLISGTGLEDTGLQDTELLPKNDQNNNNNMKMDHMMSMP